MPHQCNCFSVKLLTADLQVYQKQKHHLKVYFLILITIKRQQFLRIFWWLFLCFQLVTSLRLTWVGKVMCSLVCFMVNTVWNWTKNMSVHNKGKTKNSTTIFKNEIHIFDLTLILFFNDLVSSEYLSLSEGSAIHSSRKSSVSSLFFIFNSWQYLNFRNNQLI